jgi:hypothetical protein
MQEYLGAVDLVMYYNSEKYNQIDYKEPIIRESLL